MCILLYYTNKLQLRFCVYIFVYVVYGIYVYCKYNSTIWEIEFVSTIWEIVSTIWEKQLFEKQLFEQLFNLDFKRHFAFLF